MAVPNMWRIKQQRYRLQGETCTACDNAIFPPRQVCPRCGSALDGRPARQGQPVAFGIAYQPQAVMLEQPAGDD